MLSNVRDSLRSDRKISAGYHPTVYPMRLSITKRFQKFNAYRKMKNKNGTIQYAHYSRKTNQSLKSINYIL